MELYGPSNTQTLQQPLLLLELTKDDLTKCEDYGIT